MSEITLIRHDCGRLVYWALKDPTQPEHDFNKKIPHWPKGGHHYCFHCGAAGWDSKAGRPTKGCGVLVIPLEKTQVIDGKTFKFQVLYNADGQAARRHHCKYVDELREREKGNWPDLFVRKLEEEDEEIEWPDKDFMASASFDTHQQPQPQQQMQIQRASDMLMLDDILKDAKAIRREVDAIKASLTKAFPFLNFD